MKDLFSNQHSLLVSLSLSCPALHCNCTNCERTGFECVTDGACMASTYISQGKEEHVRICIDRDHLVPPGQPFYCLSAEGLLNTHCCYEDYCNSVDLKAPGESPLQIILTLNRSPYCGPLASL